MKIAVVRAAAMGRGDAVFVLAADARTVAAGEPLAAAIARARASGDLKTGFRATAVFHQPAGSPLRRLGVVGLGKESEVTAERLRRAAAVAQSRAAELEVASFGLVLADGVCRRIGPSAAGQAVAEGLVLGAYRYDGPRRQRPKPRHASVGRVAAAGLDRTGLVEFERGVALGRIAGAATVFARDLENQPANVCTPSALARAARRLARGRTRVRVVGVPAMRRLGMGALLGVAQGSAEPPCLIVLEHRVPGAKETVCVIGKGLTFDTGGISIKPAAKMDEMRYDMCGAGAVLGLFHAIAHGGLAGSRPRANIVGLVAAAENMPDARAQRPGDVVRAMDGHTIEVLNTDAEGRLVLADAICYAKKFHRPRKIVDLATLTGAVVVALGHEVAGVMGNDQKLVDALLAAGRAADEPLWQLPLWDCHKEQVKSRFADLANINGPQHGNGAIAGAAFLSYFAGDTPWAHIDIAGTAYGGISKDYYRSGASGTAVRTLLAWLRSS